MPKLARAKLVSILIDSDISRAPVPAFGINHRELSRGLVYLAYPGGTRRNELLSDKTISATGNVRYFGKTVNGQAIATLNSNSNFILPWSNRLSQIGTDFTILFGANLTMLSASAVLFGQHVDEVNNSFALLFGRSASSTRGLLICNINPNSSVVSDTGFISANNGYIVYGVTRSGTSVSFFRKGSPFRVPVALPNANPVDFGTQEPIQILGRRSLTNGLVGSCDFVGVWARALSAAEVGKISRNPFALIRNPYFDVPQNKIMFSVYGY
jgi:hypothetical protein